MHLTQPAVSRSDCWMMEMKFLSRSCRSLLVLAVLVLPTRAHAQGDNPLIGTWEFDRELSCGEPAGCDQRLTMRFQETESGFMTYLHSRVNASGNPTFIVGAFKLDGQPYPWYRHTDVLSFLTTGEPTPNTRKWTRTGEFEFSSETNGVGTMIYTISPDGQSVVRTRVSAEGVELQAPEHFNRVD